MEIKYNNNTYEISPKESLKDLLERGDLMGLPLSVWKEIFEKKDQYVSVTILNDILLKTIDWYDNSEHVNQFTFKGVSSWLDKETRVGLMHLANCSTEDLSLVLNDNIVTISPEVLKLCLTALEVYAGKCYVLTAKHKLAALDLLSIEEIINYDYTAGYPEKLVIE